MVTDNEFKALIPPLTGEEYIELEKSILAEGCRDALVLWGETIIDGHNRAEICERCGVPYRTVQAELSSREEAKAWILRNQLARRNLTEIDKLKLASQLKTLLSSLAKIKEDIRKTEFDQLVKVDNPTINARKEAARKFGVSEGSLHRFESVIEKAPEPVIKAMEDNVISINKAYELTKAAIDRPELKNRLESASPAHIPQITAEDLLREKERLDKDFKRQSQIINYWSIMNSLAYSDYDYQVWLSDLTEEGIENQLRTVDTGVEKAKEIQERLHKICNERRKLRLVK